MKKQLEAIRKIDAEAAEYIETVVIERYGGIDKLNPNFDLLDQFIWGLTPQGRDQWFLIWKQLNEKSDGK